MRVIFNRIFYLAFAAILLSVPAAADQVFYLVRHAEKIISEDRNPALTEEGQARANWLAHYFSDKGLTAIYSTDYLRTQQTAAPTAAATGLPVKSYNPRDLPGFSESLKQSQGIIMVAGHSNTTPILAGLLVGQNLEELDERIYDHIYVVRIADDGHASLKIDYSEPRTVLSDEKASNE